MDRRISPERTVNRESRDRNSHRERKHRHPRRSRSPRRDDDRHRHKRRRTRSRSPPPKPVALPYKAKPLSKRHYEEYRPLFQSYLDIQKQIQLEDLDEREAKGRWKSFTNRWYARHNTQFCLMKVYADIIGIVET